MKKCPFCGADNRDKANFCVECARLIDEYPELINDTAPVRDSNDYPEISHRQITTAERSVDGEDTERDVKMHKGGRRRFAERPCDDEDTPVAVPRLFDDDDSTNNGRFDSPQDDEDFDDMDDDDLDDVDIADDEEYDNHKSESRHGNAVFGLVTVILLLLIVVLFAVFLRTNYEGSFELFIANTFSDKVITKTATLAEDETKSGEPAILITVYARKGCIVRFEEGSTQNEAVVEGRSVSFRVPQSLWIPAEPIPDGHIEIYPTVYVIDVNSNNAITKVEFEAPITITIPLASITLLSPESTELVTTSPTVQIEGKVSDTTTSVYLGEELLQIDENGYFRCVYHIPGPGTHTVYIEARKAGHETCKKKLTITYTETEIDLQVTSESLRTFEDTITVEGTMQKGARLSVSGIELDGDVIVDSEAGTFKFVAKVPNIGLYTPTLTLSSGDVDATTTLYIEHAPNLDDYVESSRSYDYDWIVSHPTMQAHYEIKGTIVEVYQSEPFVRARLHTSQGDIVFTYYHTTQVVANDGVTYKIHAYLDGTDTQTGLPLMYCWFVYKS